MTYKLYKTTTCAYCPMVLKFCKLKNIEPEQILIDDDLETRNWLHKLTGQMTVPVLMQFDESGEPKKFVVGYNAGKLTELLG